MKGTYVTPVPIPTDENKPGYLPAGLRKNKVYKVMKVRKYRWGTLLRLDAFKNKWYNQTWFTPCEKPPSSSGQDAGPSSQ